MIDIKDFDITAERGFLTPHDMSDVSLPDECAPLEAAGAKLSGYMTAGKVRDALDAIPEIDMAGLLPSLSDAQCRKLMVHFSFLVQAYVWGEEPPATTLPRNLSVPFVALADHMGLHPLLPYSAYTLDNWVKIDPKGDVTLDNIAVYQNFLGGVDENWFILVHVEIEAKAGKALAAMPPLLEALKSKDVAGVKQHLTVVRDAWNNINPVFDRMPENCDPYAYYLRVRPYIHGWKGNPALPEGLIYEGVDRFEGKPHEFRGQTGSQSSIVPTMDALLQISHEQDPLRAYLDELHFYRPPKHRAFIDAVRENSNLRDFVCDAADAELTELYNDCVRSVQAFRSRHLEYAASYINKQAKSADGNPTDVGTGGTPFMKYLKKHRDESERHILPLAS